MIKAEHKAVLVWTLSDENKKEIIKAMPKILGYAIKDGYDSISELFNALDEHDNIIYFLIDYIDFIREEIEYIDDYKENGDYVGDVIIDYVLSCERKMPIEPDLTDLEKDDDALRDFFWNHNLDEIIVDFLKGKPELKKELINFCLQ